MIVRRAFKFKLKLTALQRVLCLQFAGARRWIFNRGLDLRQKAFAATGKGLSYFEQNVELTTLKEVPEFSWLREIHSQVLQQSLKDLNSAFQNFFRRLKKGGKPGSKIQEERAKREFSFSPRS